MLADHAAGTGGDSDPSMRGVNSDYPRLGLGAMGVAPWQQQRWTAYENSPRLRALIPSK